MTIRTRSVIHFPGFEPLSALDHRNRYARAAESSGSVWNARFRTGPLEGVAFRVSGEGPDWATEARVTVLDHDGLIAALRSTSLARQILSGYLAGARVVMNGGMAGYFRHAWRFGLFFVFPFLFVACGLALALTIAFLPLAVDWPLWHLLYSVPAGALFFTRLFLPFSDRLHTLHLFADWRLAVDVAALETPATRRWIEHAVAQLEAVLAEEADEYLITAHSMGASLALQVVGAALERNPDLFRGKSVCLATLGGAALQCALMRQAAILRGHVARVAACRDLVWFEVQSLTDPVHLYRARTVAACGFPDLPQPPIVPFRFRTVLSEERYQRIKTDILRMHRQYVLGPDRRGSFDFTLMTAGPLPAASFRLYTQQVHPPLGEDGSVSATKRPAP